MIGQLNMQGHDKVETAIMRLQMFEPAEGYYLAFSGGKDSVVIKALADMAKVKYDAHYSVTTVDPPELVTFIRDIYPDVIFEKARYKDGTQITMWNLIPKLVECRWNKLIFTRNSDVEYINSGNRYTVENLPEYDEQVIVTNGKDVWIDAFNDMGDGVRLSETDDDIDGVVAWMELPVPYKEE